MLSEGQLVEVRCGKHGWVTGRVIKVGRFAHINTVRQFRAVVPLDDVNEIVRDHVGPLAITEARALNAG